MLPYAVVFERAETGFAGYVPELPGCIATGRTFDAVQSNIREAIEFHLEGMREDGEPISEPTTRVAVVEVEGAP